jgi:transcriptional regulator NrdR family protein
VKCPACGGLSEVLKARSRDRGASVRRRRQCLKRACKHRWTTIEFEAARVVAYVPKPVAGATGGP